MSKKPRDNRPYLRPVTRVELSERNIKLRWILIAVFLAIAVVAIGYGFHAAMSIEPGWQEVTVLSDEVNCSGDFRLMYDFGADGTNATAAHKKLETLYGDLTVSGYRLFSPEAEGTDNLYHINAHVNETVTVAPELYEALEKIVLAQTRVPYMAPVTMLYAPVFLAENDVEAAIYDPAKDDQLALLARETAGYCADPQRIRLEVLGQNQVRLIVDDAYLAFAEECGIETFLDLGWMKNAFLVDYMADALAEAGFTCGYLASFDGYTRNLDGRGEDFSLNLFHRVDNNVYMPAVLAYNGPMSLVTLRDYPHSERDKWTHYAYGDGTITTVYLNPGDGQPGTCIDSVTGYSRELGCGDILLELEPVFLAEAFDAQRLESMARKGIHSFYCQDKTLFSTDDQANLLIQDAAYNVVISNTK